MSRMSRSSVMLKKEIKMSFLKDVFQTADEIKQSQEKLKDAVDASSRQAAALIRPYLSEVQNEILSENSRKAGRIRCRATRSKIGYSSAMQTFAEAAAALEAGGPCATVKTKTALPAPTGKAAIGTGMMCDAHSHFL